MARSPFIDRAIRVMRQGAEDVVQRALVDTVKTELSRVLTSARPDTFEQWIDGRPNAAIEQIKAHGVAYFEFSYIRTIIGFAAAQLRELSPEDFVHPDQRVFRESHLLFCDGREVGTLTEGGDTSFIDRLSPRSEFVITNSQPYAGKIERGQSDQAPNGVFRLAASTVSRRYGSIVTSRFLWLRMEGLDEAQGYPAIAIQAR
ncbi:hypothetical protein GBZ48_31515 [Azospirillum melinis]|uniref:Uncharacterized protein n=1 Tax=Azospirillum melinis TaxID=328839 RepID=A0ABX2KQI3_9PROT|nr:hypothetical protein [Azospirillum melinis]MBP2310494.1 hypothetical protein [Azospirillum melinis]NUB03746.1 hypothetical protein [Azospirillum melinis]